MPNVFTIPIRATTLSGVLAILVAIAGCDPEQPGAEYGQEEAAEQQEATTDTMRRQAEEPEAAPGERSPGEEAPGEEARETPAGTEDESAVVPRGTELSVTLGETVSTESHEEGDRFAAEVTEDVRGRTGRVLLPGGTRVEGVVAESRRSAGADEQAVLALRLDSIQIADRKRPLAATVQDARAERTEGDTGAETAAKIAIGTAAGALVGQILGESTESALGGAAAGAAAGAVVALTTREGDAVLEEGSIITIRLDEPIRVDPGET